MVAAPSPSFPGLTEREAEVLAQEVHEELAGLDRPRIVELGFDEVYLHHVGQEQRGWLEVFGEKVLPQLDVTAKVAAA